MFTRAEFESFMQRVPDRVLVVLDEAYTVYAEANPDYPDGLSYEMDNLLVLRTLSKAYGLAGIRIGFAYGKEYLIREMYKVKLPFEPNQLAQDAAIAALDDDEFLQRTIELNRQSLELMGKKFNDLGIDYIHTSANFYLLIFPDEEFAAEFNNQCLNRGLILRHVNTFGIPNGIRINSGTLEETEFALQVLEEVYNLMTEKHNN
jgi:histidinol-phosphate aminotransferase